MIITSHKHQEQIEKAAEEIYDNCRAGAIDAYLDGDTALEYLGELIRIQQQRRKPGETPSAWYERVSAELDAKIQRIIDKTVEDNAEHVAQEKAEDELSYAIDMAVEKWKFRGQE